MAVKQTTLAAKGRSDQKDKARAGRQKETTENGSGK